MRAGILCPSVRLLPWIWTVLVVVTVTFAGEVAQFGIAQARDVSVKEYFRKNGTYVRPHIRSSPDAFKSNNYGPSRTDSQLMLPRTRDADLDGTPNYLDQDDNNNGIGDELDLRQYGQRVRGLVPLVGVGGGLVPLVLSPPSAGREDATPLCILPIDCPLP
jgi:hypothetical protein